MKLSVLTFLAFLTAGGALAQQPEQSTDGRFQMQRTEKGIVRLDTRTGAMTLCHDENGTLACRMQPDERAAYDDEIDRLEKRVAALEKQAGQKPAAALPPARAMPSDEEIDRSLSIMERFMRSFMGMVKEFSDEEKPQPSRT